MSSSLRRRSVAPTSLVLVLSLGVSSFAYISGRYTHVKHSPTCATLKYGAHGPAVARIQSFVGTRPDGDFGPATAAAVRKWQRHHHLRTTGAIGPATWAALPQDVALDACSRPAHGTGTSMTCAYLHQGSTGPAVKVLQRRVRAAVDGAFGPLTRAAVARAQRAAKLPGHGIVGPATWAALGLSGTPACRAVPRHHLSAHAKAVRAVARQVVALAARLHDHRARTHNPIARAALHFARQQKGKPYVWGGVGPKGYDCSGLMMRAYAKAGVRIPRVANDQYDAGEPVLLSHVRAGDLVFHASDLTNPRTIYHVGMYVGHAKVLDAPYTGAFIGTRSLWTAGLLPVVVRPASQLNFPLRPGKSGDSVARLQRALNRHHARLTVDGAYGPMTRKAVNRWKKHHHLKPNGVVRRRTWVLLF
jgi:peptidoglycan hydrolase-like protein with peptidoglycan-binding domain